MPTVHHRGHFLARRGAQAQEEQWCPRNMRTPTRRSSPLCQSGPVPRFRSPSDDLSPRGSPWRISVHSASNALDIGLTVSEKCWGEEHGDTSKNGG